MELEKNKTEAYIYLTEEFERRRNKNHRYSIRAFARTLNIDSSTLSQILKGTRRLTFFTAKKIFNELKMDIEKKEKILMSLAEVEFERSI